MPKLKAELDRLLKLGIIEPIYEHTSWVSHIYHMDDVLIYANSVEKHDQILQEVLSKLHAEGITLNRKKCEIGVKVVKYLGHLISESGVSVDPDRVKAIREFPNPENKTELI